MNIKQQFNINSWIWVKLNDKGYQHLADLHNSLCGVIKNWDEHDAAYYKAQADSNGYSQFQMWHFMEDFGPQTAISKPSLFDMTILLDERDLKPLTDQPDHIGS